MSATASRMPKTMPTIFKILERSLSARGAVVEERGEFAFGGVFSSGWAVFGVITIVGGVTGALVTGRRILGAETGTGEAIGGGFGFGKFCGVEI